MLVNTIYRDGRGSKVFISLAGGNGGSVWQAVLQRPGKGGTHKITSVELPARETLTQAQADLDAYAKRKKWRPL